MLVLDSLETVHVTRESFAHENVFNMLQHSCVLTYFSCAISQVDLYEKYASIRHNWTNNLRKISS